MRALALLALTTASFKRLLTLFMLFIMGFTAGCGTGEGSPYKEHCVADVGCDADFFTDAMIESCEGEWMKRAEEAKNARCTLEFDYYFECVETEFSCALADQICFASRQEYEGCLAR